MLKFIHAADFHLDSAFGSLNSQQAAARRRESRELPFRLTNYVNQNQIDLVLLAGDLFDSSSIFRETGEQLASAFAQMQAKVFIAPGNHDWYGPGSPWLSVSWPENVHIFSDTRFTAVDLPQWNVTVHGSAFCAPQQSMGLLSAFSAPSDGRIHIGLLHGEAGTAESSYNPVSKEEIAASGLHYLALGHIHKRTQPFTCGTTLCAWPGCPEGHGFDELGEKGFYTGTLSEEGNVSLTFVPFARRKYEIISVDITGRDPYAALEAVLPSDTSSHLYRILLTGETAEQGVDTAALRASLSDRFYFLDIRDHTCIAQDVWARAQEDSLRGLFLRQLHDKLIAAHSEEERLRITQAARFGLAALDHRDIESLSKHFTEEVCIL